MRPAGTLIAAFIAILVVGMWLWVAWCTFPLHGWNAIRVAPALMLAEGVNPYPELHAGPITTWIYGPLPIFWMLPLVFAGDTTGALFLASGLNLFLAAIPFLIVALFQLRQSGGVSGVHVIWIPLVGFALWPASNLHFWQADNLAVTCGILANLMFAGSQATHRGKLWFAAFLATAALWSKQTELAPILGQLVFAAWRDGLRFMMGQAARIVAAASLLALLFLGLFGADGLWLNMFRIPGEIPRTGLLEKLFSPVYRPYTAIYFVLPLLLVAWRRRQIFSLSSSWCLPGLVFAASLPLNLMGFVTIGGNVNSLHAFLYLVPMTTVALATRAGRQPIIPLAVVTGALALQAAITQPMSFRPLRTPLNQGAALAAQLQGEVHFPWNPLLTYYNEGRFYHVEDGLLTRAVTGHYPSDEEIFQHLPERISFFAYQGYAINGILYRFATPNAPPVQFGSWILIPVSKPFPTQEAMVAPPPSTAP